MAVLSPDSAQNYPNLALRTVSLKTKLKQAQLSKLSLVLRICQFKTEITPAKVNVLV